ncbi:MAG: DUF4097 family beta strand repeat protein [Proteobacteria bacterium]|nr:DUF4097 family beta strand repeat protein [Pseudomonadota bacterium]
MNNKGSILCAAILALTIIVPASAAAVDQKVQADPHGTVEVNNAAGRIRCIGWEKPEIQITGELGGSDRLDVQRQGATTTIRVLSRLGISVYNEAELEIKIPAASSLRVSAVSADVEVSGVSGDQRLQSVSGDVQTEAAKADVTLKSISGNVKVRGKREALHTIVSTVSGSSSVIDVGGELEFGTVSGDSIIDMSSLTRARLKTISGDVKMTAKLAPEARVDASSVSGDLQLRWLGVESSNIELESFSGEIDSCFGGVPVQHPTYGPGSSWRYGPKDAPKDVKGDIHVKSMSGDIHLCNR